MTAAARRVVLAPEQRLAIVDRMEAIQRARDSFVEFVRFVCRASDGTRMLVEPMHMAWHQHVNYCWAHRLNAGVMAHWSSGKSASFSTPLACWVLGRNPNKRVQIICNTDENAQDRIRLASQIITQSPEYHAVFPWVKPSREQWSKHKLTVKRKGYSQDPSLAAYGIFTGGTGSHADIQLLDDPVDLKNSRDIGGRKKVAEFLTDTWFGRLDPGGFRALVCTPWYKGDAYDALSAMEDWSFLIQRVNDGCTAIEQEVTGVIGPDYPLLQVAA